MEYKQYFLPDGRSFDSVFRGTGGDQDLGYKLSDGRDVGRVYQRANATLNSGYYRGNDDIGHLLLSQDAVAKAVARKTVTWTSRYPREGLFYIQLDWEIQGGSGNFNVGWLSSEGQTFGDDKWINTGYVYTGLHGRQENRANVTYSSQTGHMYMSLLFQTKYIEIGGQRLDPQWMGRTVNVLRCGFVDNVTGVTYTSEPLYVVKSDAGDLPQQFQYLRGACDYHCSCDINCPSDCYDSCCEGSN